MPDGGRDWRVDVLAGVVVVAVICFGLYSLSRARLADARATRTQQALCSLIDRYPTGLDKGIDQARAIGDCGHVRPPTVFIGRPTPSRTVIVVTPSPAPTRTVVMDTPAGSPRPSPTRTSAPRPRPTPSHTPTPRPSPTPTKTPCLLPGVPPGCG